MMRITLLCVVAAVAGNLAGCANTPKQATADSTEYEWVTPTGSNIAVRVPKGQRATVGTAPTSTLTGEQAATILNTAGGKVPVDKGGR
jgi:hypothetical protein